MFWLLTFILLFHCLLSFMSSTHSEVPVPPYLCHLFCSCIYSLNPRSLRLQKVSTSRESESETEVARLSSITHLRFQGNRFSQETLVHHILWVVFCLPLRIVCLRIHSSSKRKSQPDSSNGSGELLCSSFSSSLYSRLEIWKVRHTSCIGILSCSQEVLYRVLLAFFRFDLSLLSSFFNSKLKERK